MSLPKVVGDIY